MTFSRWCAGSGELAWSRKRTWSPNKRGDWDKNWPNLFNLKILVFCVFTAMWQHHPLFGGSLVQNDRNKFQACAKAGWGVDETTHICDARYPGASWPQLVSFHSTTRRMGMWHPAHRGATGWQPRRQPGQQTPAADPRGERVNPKGPTGGVAGWPVPRPVLANAKGSLAGPSSATGRWRRR